MEKVEKVLIEQLLNSGVSLKKIKSIIENTEKAKEDLNKLFLLIHVV